MRRFLIIIWGLFFLHGCKDGKSLNDAQQPGNFNKSEYHQNVQIMPMPEGGMEAILSKLVYPPEATGKGIEGKVQVQAFIDENGKVVKAEVLKSADPLLDKAALDAIYQVKFTPGYSEGKAEKTQVVIPVVFKLGDHKNNSGNIQKKGDYYVQADEMPQIVGGVNELARRIKYPEAEKKSGVQGTVYIQLNIDEKGKIEKKEISKGVNKNLDEAALNAFDGLKFTPGKVKGKNVKMEITLPITFKLK